MMVLAAATSSLDSETRTAILDSARAPVVAELGKPVLFRVARLEMRGDWAFLRADMEGPGGQPIDYRDTSRAEAAEHGAVSRVYVALLRRKGERWDVVDKAIGPTDVAWDGWAERHGAPAEIFG